MKAHIPLSAVLLVLSSCTGEIGDAGPATPGLGTAGAGGSGNASGSGGTGNRPVGIDEVVGVDPETLPDGVPGSSRVLRLSYADYDRTLSDLLHLQIGVSANFPANGACATSKSKP